MAKKQLRITEEEFWHFTPRKLWAMLNCAMTYKKQLAESILSDKGEAKDGVRDGTIDDIKW